MPANVTNVPSLRCSVIIIICLLFFSYSVHFAGRTSRHLTDGSRNFDLRSSGSTMCDAFCEHGDCINEYCFCHKGFEGEMCDNGFTPDCVVARSKGEADYVECTSFIPGFGTTQIPPDLSEYWHKAQSWELSYWANTTESEDRVKQHFEWYENYESLKSQLESSEHRLGNMVEIGCGPFTQSIPLIKQVGPETLDSLTLVDPLLDLYLQKVLHVPYRDVSRFLFDKPTNLVRVDAEQAGSILQSGHFDTVVMLNVIEHATNAIQILQTLWSLAKPGGILVFHEYNYDDREFIWEEGHPIKLHASTYEFLLRNFDTIYRKDFSHVGDYGHAKGVYFIGRKPLL